MLETSVQVTLFEQQVFRVRYSRTPTDPLYDPFQWHLQNSGAFVGSVAGEDTNIVPAWNAGFATEAADVAAFTGTVLVQGDLAVTEAIDTFAAAGITEANGDLAVTEAIDTFAATGITEANGDLAVTFNPCWIHSFI